MVYELIASDDFADLGNGVSPVGRTLAGSAGLKWALTYVGVNGGTGDGAGNLKGEAYLCLENGDGTPFLAYKVKVKTFFTTMNDIFDVRFQSRRGTGDQEQAAFSRLDNNLGYATFWNSISLNVQSSWQNAGISYAGVFHETGIDINGLMTMKLNDVEYRSLDDQGKMVKGLPIQTVLYLQTSNVKMSSIEIWVEPLSDGDIYCKTYDQFMTDKITVLPDSTVIDGRAWNGPGVLASYEGESLVWDGNVNGAADPWRTWAADNGYAARADAWAGPKLASGDFWTSVNPHIWASSNNVGFHFAGAFDLSAGWGSHNGYYYQSHPTIGQTHRIHEIINGVQQAAFSTFTGPNVVNGMPTGIRIYDDGTKMDCNWLGETIKTVDLPTAYGPLTPVFYCQDVNSAWAGMNIMDVFSGSAPAPVPELRLSKLRGTSIGIALSRYRNWLRRR